MFFASTPLLSLLSSLPSSRSRPWLPSLPSLRRAAAVAALALAAALGAAPPALAHGVAEARHGGVVQGAADLSFELVATADGAAVFIDDHGKALPPAGFGGRLTVLHGGQSREAVLEVAGERLLARGLALAPGARAVAVLTTPRGQTLTLRFVVR
jgi:hypothetical protein